MKRHSKYWCPITPMGWVVIGTILFIGLVCCFCGCASKDRISKSQIAEWNRTLVVEYRDIDGNKIK